MFTVLILICSTNVDRAACSSANAVDVVHGPNAHTLAQCVQESQSTIAATSIAPEPGKQYLKIVCAPAQAPS
jgi:hypothetical protein